MPSTFFVALLLFACAVAGAPLPHPRLILTPSRRAAIAAGVAAGDSASLAFLRATEAQAAYVLAQPPPGPSGPSSTPSARPRLQNLYTLALADAGRRGSGAPPNATLLSRAKREVLGPCASPQWDTNGTAQLNTGEMLHVCGLALDWLAADVLSGAERAGLVSAIVSTGLARVREALSPSPPPWAVAFVSTRSNWNTVILGGSIIAALAVAGEPGAPAWVQEELLPRAIANLGAWSGLGWGPDGAWAEGPNYGGYAARYLAPTVAALRSATGSDAGLSALPGVLQSPRFLLAAMAPNLQYFYYYDTRCDPETVASYLAFAVLAGDADSQRDVVALVLALAPSVPPSAQGNNAMNAPIALLYYVPLASAAPVAAAPLIAHFGGAELVTARASSAAGAAFAGFKGRTTEHGLWAHTHLDGGSFVFQSRGQWWAQDLGSDEYSAPDYFGKGRFKLYRTSSLGHNTLTFGGANQFCEIEATYACNCSQVPMVVFNTTAAALPLAPAPFAPSAFAVVDLTGAYAPLGLGLISAQRGFIVSATVEQLVVVDEVAFLGAGSAPLPPLLWSMHTVATVALSGDGLSAALSMHNVSGVQVGVRVLPGCTVCPGAAFSLVPVALAPPLLPSPGVQRLMLSAPAASCARLCVAVGELGVDFDVGSVRPLSQWQALGPLG